MSEERVELYRRPPPPPGRIIPVVLESFHVEDLVPEEGEVAGAVHHLHLNKACSPSGMRAEHLWVMDTGGYLGGVAVPLTVRDGCWPDPDNFKRGSP